MVKCVSCGYADDTHASTCPYRKGVPDREGISILAGTCSECGDVNGHTPTCTQWQCPSCKCLGGEHDSDCPNRGPKADTCVMCGCLGGKHKSDCPNREPKLGEMIMFDVDGKRVVSPVPAIGAKAGGTYCPECNSINMHLESCSRSKDANEQPQLKLICPECGCGGGKHTAYCSGRPCPDCGARKGRHHASCSTKANVCPECGVFWDKHKSSCPLLPCPECKGLGEMHLESCSHSLVDFEAEFKVLEGRLKVVQTELAKYICDDYMNRFGVLRDRQEAEVMDLVGLYLDALGEDSGDRDRREQVRKHWKDCANL